MKFGELFAGDEDIRSGFLRVSFPIEDVFVDLGGEGPVGVAADDTVEVFHAAARTDKEAESALAKMHFGTFAIDEGEARFAPIAIEGIDRNVVHIRANPFAGVSGYDPNGGVFGAVTFSSFAFATGGRTAGGEDEILGSSSALIPTRTQEGEGAAFLGGAWIGGDVKLIGVAAEFVILEPANPARGIDGQSTFSPLDVILGDAISAGLFVAGKVETLVHIDPDVIHDEADQELVVVRIFGNYFAGKLVWSEEVGLLAERERHGFSLAVCVAFELIRDFEIKEDGAALDEFGFGTDHGDVAFEVGLSVPLFLVLGFHAATPMREVAEDDGFWEFALIVSEAELVGAVVDEVVIAVFFEGDSRSDFLCAQNGGHGGNIEFVALCIAVADGDVAPEAIAIALSGPGDALNFE